MKKFSIPVTWEVWDKIEIEAETIVETLKDSGKALAISDADISFEGNLSIAFESRVIA